MPAQKRILSENPDPDMDESPPQGNLFCLNKPQHKQDELEEEEEDCKNVVIVEETAEEIKVEGKVEEDGVHDCTRRCDDAQKEDSDGSPSSGCEEKPEFVFVELPNIRKDVQCPICLGIIKKTRTVMECLHRFCRECIDKSMRMGNNECPACRTHCPSRRSLRDDPNYDALIAALYPDIEKYEEEELAFHEEEKNRNKQIQESISLIFQRQEALNKRRSMGKDTINGGAYLIPQRKNHNTLSKKRQNGRVYEPQRGSDDSDDENVGAKSSSCSDEHCMEIVKPRRGRRRQSPLPSSSVINWADGNELELGREMFGWGKGGARSHTRHGIASGSNNRTARNARLTRLLDHLRSLDANDVELDVHLMLVSLDEQTPSLHKPYLCCRPSLSVEHLREYIALHTLLKVEEVEILRIPTPSSKDVQILKGHETLAGLKATRACIKDQLILAYRLKGDSAYL